MKTIHIKVILTVLVITASIGSRAQHIINLIDHPSVYCQIVTLQADRVDFTYLKQDKVYSIPRSVIESIAYLGMDEKLIKDNYNLKRPYAIASLAYNDEITFKNIKFYGEFSFYTVDTKVLKLDGEQVTCIFKLGDKDTIETFLLSDIEIILYSEETINYVLKEKTKTSDERIITKDGDIINCFVYELGPKMIRYSLTQIQQDVIKFDTENYRTIYKEAVGLKFIPYSQVVRVQDREGLVYLPQVEQDKNGKVSKSQKLKKQRKYFVDVFAARGVLLSEAPKFVNERTIDLEYSQLDPSETFSTYHTVGASFSMQIQNDVYGSVGYKRVFSNTAKTNSVWINSNQVSEVHQSINYQHDIQVIEFGLGVQAETVFSNLRLGRVSAKNKFLVEKSVYKNFEETSNASASGYYTTKSKISIGFDLGYKISYKNISILPTVRFDRISLESNEVVISNRSSTDGMLFDGVGPTVDYLSFDIVNYFYIPAGNTVTLFSYGLMLRYSFRR